MSISIEINPFDRRLHKEGDWKSSQYEKVLEVVDDITCQIHELVKKEVKNISELDTRPKKVSDRGQSIYNPFVYESLIALIKESL